MHNSLCNASWKCHHKSILVYNKYPVDVMQKFRSRQSPSPYIAEIVQFYTFPLICVKTESLHIPENRPLLVRKSYKATYTKR